MSVKKIAEDTYAIRNFLQSMPHIHCVVRFENEAARVIERTGYTTDKKWDQLAIQTVQSNLMHNLVD